MAPAPSLADLRHVFISFAHADREAANRVARLFDEAGIPFWADFDSLPVGTPDWEAAIRTAIGQSFAVVYLASPSARGSVYVKGELDVAQSKGVTVFPVWVAGESWADCAPLRLIAAQHVDCRGQNAEAGTKLVELLTAHIDRSLPDHFPVSPMRWAEPQFQGAWVINRKPPPGYVGIELGRPKSGDAGGRGVMVKVSRYPNLAALLDDLYVHYLADAYAPLTYGTDWVLCERCSWGRVAVPLAWMRSREPVRDWARTLSPADIGFTSGANWFAARPPEDVFGLAVNHPDILEALNASIKAAIIFAENGILRRAPLRGVDEGAYRLSYVIRGKLRPHEGEPVEDVVIVQNRPNSDALDRELEYWLWRRRR